MQAEATVLAELHSSAFPRLLYSQYFTVNPVTDDPLAEPLYVSIEEWIHSEPLSKRIDLYVGQPQLVFGIAIQLIEALKPFWEHSRRYVHRDLKPENILLRPDGQVVVIDFGIIRETGVAGVTEDGWGKAPLTVDYAAPEHIANDKNSISFKTDFFSIGVLMYRLISGVHPFRTRSRMDNHEVAEATETLIPPTLHELNLCTERQSLVISKMMEKKPYLRTRTIDELLSSLKEVGD